MTFVNNKFEEFVNLKYPEGIPDLFRSHLQYAFLSAYTAGASMASKTIGASNPMMTNLFIADLKKTVDFAEEIRQGH
jgi:hypothetical protein